MKTCEVSGITGLQCKRTDGCRLRQLNEKIDNMSMLNATIAVAKNGCQDQTLITDLEQGIIPKESLAAKQE